MRPNIYFLLKQNLFIVGILFSIFLAEIAPWIGAQGGSALQITCKFYHLPINIDFFLLLYRSFGPRNNCKIPGCVIDFLHKWAYS